MSLSWVDCIREQSTAEHLPCNKLESLSSKTANNAFNTGPASCALVSRSSWSGKWPLVGGASLVLSSILKGFMGCKVRTLLNLWNWICTYVRWKIEPTHLSPVALNDTFSSITEPRLATLWPFQDVCFIVLMDGPMSKAKSNILVKRFVVWIRDTFFGTTIHTLVLLAIGTK